jgi:3-methyladenine DNA glycosylase AlkD
MRLDDVLAELESLGTEQNRKIYARHGAGENQFGVSFANLNALKKRVKKDQALAEALWQTGNADARSLATMIVDPATMSADDMDRWLNDVESARYYLLADLIVRYVAGPSPLARTKAEQWTRSDAEYIGQAGWELLGVVAMQDRSSPDGYFEPYLKRIESEVHRAKNRVRHAMNSALIAIGIRNEAFRERAFSVAAAIGKVRVDHGQTGCKTPDATAYIKKSWARKGVAAR